MGTHLFFIDGAEKGQVARISLTEITPWDYFHHGPPLIKHSRDRFFDSIRNKGVPLIAAGFRHGGRGQGVCLNQRSDVKGLSLGHTDSALKLIESFQVSFGTKHVTGRRQLIGTYLHKRSPNSI